MSSQDPDKIISHRSRRLCFWGSTLVNCNVAIPWSLGSPTYVLKRAPCFGVNHIGLQTIHLHTLLQDGSLVVINGVITPLIGVITPFGIFWLFGLFPTQSDLHPTSSWFKIYAVTIYILLMEEILHQLRLVVYPIICRGVDTSQVVLYRISEPSTVSFTESLKIQGLIKGAETWQKEMETIPAADPSGVWCHVFSPIKNVPNCISFFGLSN